MEKSNLMLIVILVLMVALLATVVAVAIFAAGALTNISNDPVMMAGFEQAPTTLTPDQTRSIQIGDRIVTNIIGETGRDAVTSIQVSVAIDNTRDVESVEFYNLMTEQMDFLRMVALSSIRRFTAEELTAADGMNRLAAEILDALTVSFRTNMIIEVRFTEWAITTI